MAVSMGISGSSKNAVTHYELIKPLNKNYDFVSFQLETGRTHQIRAQMASVGHPLLGDGKYGRLAADKKAGFNKQALCSYSLKFAFRTDAGILNYLNGREFHLDGVWFADQLFSEKYRDFFQNQF